MENDVDIYADLPSFSLNPEKDDQDCNCKDLKKEFSTLVSKLEDIQRIKTNLEKNLSSLLKTARAEIARKDKMIDDLRKRLDDVTFRRNNKSEASGFFTHRLPHQHTVTRKYENVPSTHSQESEAESHQIQLHHDEYKSRKPQIDVNRLPTLFGDRLQKKIMEDEKEKEQKALLKLSAEVKTKDIPKNNVVGNDKENESQFSINNIETNIGRCSNSESPERNPYRKNLLKRTNEEDDTCRHKCLKIEHNEDKAMTEETDYNYLTRCHLTDNPAPYEMKDGLVKFEDRPNAAQKEEVSFRTKHRATSEYRDTKQDQSSNGWRNDVKNNSARDYDSVRNDLADSLRNSRSASTSNYVSEGFNNGYKKNRYRYSPPKRSYSRSRSDYENLSSHRLRERSSRTYRGKKYDDYKYDSRYKHGRLKWSYENEENDGKTRYKRGERVLRDRARYSSSDAEDKESSSYKNKKYENRRIKKENETANVLNDKKLYETNKATAETNFRESSSRTIINNTTNYNAGKNIEQQVKNESEIKSKNLMENTSADVAIEDLDILEEGEILDSPEKKNNFTKISENNIKSISVEDKNEDISVNVSIDDRSKPFQNDANSTKQVEMVDISTKKIEVASCLLQQNTKDCKEVIQSSSSKSDMAVDEVYNCRKDEDTCKSYINKDLMDSTTQNIEAIKQVRDSDIDSNDKNKTDKTSKDSITETAKIKEITANIESVTKIKELDDSNIESATEKEEINNPNIERVAEITEVNNFNSDNSIRKIDGDKLKISTAKVEAVPNCDIEDRDKSQAPTESETFHQTSAKSNVEMCLNDHNYVQNPFINVSNVDAIRKPSSRLECDEVVKLELPKVTVLKETKAEKTINVQSVNGVKRTVTSIVKNKKDQQSKGILISHRRKAVILSDSNASMTVLMNTKTSSINNCNDNDATLKPRACKISRVTAKVTCEKVEDKNN